jgi:hypothetical protein
MNIMKIATSCKPQASNGLGVSDETHSLCPGSHSLKLVALLTKPKEL